MKAYYDGLAKDEQDIPHKRDMIKAAHKGEQDFYSAYVDSNEKFDKRTSDRRGYKSLISAISRKKVDRVIVADFESLNMTHSNVISFIRYMQRHNVIVEIGESFTSDLPEDEFWHFISNWYSDYLFDKYGVALMTEEHVYVDHDHWEYPFVYLKGYESKKLDLRLCKECSFSDVVDKYSDGFFIYMPNHDTWEFINFIGVVLLKQMLESWYEIVLDSIRND